MTKTSPKPPALDPKSLPAQRSTGYPEPFRARVAGRERRRLGNALGLENFGVNLVRLEPGSESALRHWHSQQDEFVWVLEGELTLVTDAGPQVLTAGMCAGFPKGKADGHHFVNRSGTDAWYLEIGDRSPGDTSRYPDEDLAAVSVPGYKYTRRDGSAY
jgi:uncharacterized cupin superfamily protein